MELHMPEVGPSEMLGYAEVFSVWMPDVVQPAPIVEPDRMDHQRVALPVTHRIAPPGGIRIFGQIAPVGEDLAIGAIPVKNPRYVWRLNDAILGPEDGSRASGKAARGRRVFVQRFEASAVHFIGPGKDFAGFQVRRYIQAISVVFSSPKSGEIRFAVRGAGRGRGERGLAVGLPGNPGRLDFEPLRG